MGLDFDLDDGRGTLAVRHVGLRATGTHARKERLSFVRSQTAATPSTSTSTAGSMARSADGWRARSSHRTTPLKQADRIRFFAAEHFVEPARRDGHQTVAVRAGDIGDRMGLQSNIPNVCNALGGCKFEQLAAVTLAERSGPGVGPNTEFTYSIGTGSSTVHAKRPLRTRSAAAQGRTHPTPPNEAMRPRQTGSGAVPLRTAVVVPCAGSKSPGAGRMQMPDGRPMFFVARPHAAPPNPALVYRRPDDLSDDGRTFRETLDDYNRRRRQENPWRLLPAWKLYRNATYRRLANRLGTANLFILSAGWGLIGADYLTPDYDITFSTSAERYKRRLPRERYADFRQLADDDHDRVIFAGAKDYVPLFLSLTDDLDVDRVVYYNSAGEADHPNARFVRFETDVRTNWQYVWARSLLDGDIRIPS